MNEQRLVRQTAKSGTGPTLDAKVAFLGRPESYCPAPAEVIPRATCMSWVFLAGERVYPAIDQIRRDLELGRDMSPYLSDRMRRRKTKPKADPMFNDWQISHFHLGPLFERRNKLARTKGGDLLYAHIKADRAILLDVQPHGSWAMKHLLEVLLRVSPHDLPELKRVLPGQSEGWTDDEMLNHRRNGYSTRVVIGSRVFHGARTGPLCVRARHSADISSECSA